MRKLFCGAAAVLIFQSLILAAEPVATQVEPALAPNAELLARIANMPENTWLKLPPIKTAGDIGALDKSFKTTGPTVRDFCNKMVWAPERQRALYCGGGHNIHPFNDVWEYDLASNTWVCLYGADPAPPPAYAPDVNKSVEWFKAHAVLKDGLVRSPHGAPLRPCHTWWSLAYDPDRRQLLYLESHKGLFGINKNALAQALGFDPKNPEFALYGSGAGDSWLFTFDPAKREWGEVYPKVPKAGESSCLEYLPDSKTLWWLSGKTYRFEGAQKAWLPFPSAKPIPLAGETAYDPESRKMVYVDGQQTWVFSCDSGAWTLAQEHASDGGRVPESTFCYDSVARMFVLYTSLKLADGTCEPRLRLYDLKENKWIDPKPQGECPKLGNVAGYYDPARNVTVIYNQSATWVYRCKKTAMK